MKDNGILWNIIWMAVFLADLILVALAAHWLDIDLHALLGTNREAVTVAAAAAAGALFAGEIFALRQIRKLFP